MRISDWSSDVCSSDLLVEVTRQCADLVTAFAGVGCYARIETAFGDGAAGGLQSGNGLGDAPRDQPCGEADDDHADREQQQRVDAPHVRAARRRLYGHPAQRSEEHTSELQSLMRISYAVFCLKKQNTNNK